MTEQDTVRLLRECDQGVRMGIGSISEVLDSVENTQMRSVILDCKNEHEGLKERIREGLLQCGDQGKQPGVMAKSMSWMKTNAMLAMDPSDRTVADLLVEGCDMGVRSLSRYLNQYKAADENSRNIAEELIRSEADLSVALRGYL